MLRRLQKPEEKSQEDKPGKLRTSDHPWINLVMSAMAKGMGALEAIELHLPYSKISDSLTGTPDAEKDRKEQIARLQMSGFRHDIERETNVDDALRRNFADEEQHDDARYYAAEWYMACSLSASKALDKAGVTNAEHRAALIREGVREDEIQSRLIAMTEKASDEDFSSQAPAVTGSPEVMSESGSEFGDNPFTAWEEEELAAKQQDAVQSPPIAMAKQVGDQDFSSETPVITGSPAAISENENEFGDDILTALGEEVLATHEQDAIRSLSTPKATKVSGGDFSSQTPAVAGSPEVILENDTATKAALGALRAPRAPPPTGQGVFRLTRKAMAEQVPPIAPSQSTNKRKWEEQDAPEALRAIARKRLATRNQNRQRSAETRSPYD